MTACGDLNLPSDTTRSSDELLVLQLQSSAPPVADAGFYVSNARLTIQRLQHNDPFNTLYAELRFPRGALESLNGQPLAPDDSVLVSVLPRSDAFGLVLSPTGLEFAAGARPSVTFSYARYGDLGVTDTSGAYPSRAAYAAALRLWREVTPDLWDEVDGSGPAGTDAVAGTLAVPGEFVVAASR